MGIMKFFTEYKETSDISLAYEQIKGFVRILETTVNDYGFRPKDVYAEEHTETAEVKLFQFAMHWINYFGSLPIQNSKLPYGTYAVSIEEGYKSNGIFHPGRNYYMRKACEEWIADPEFCKAFEPYRFDYTKRREQNAWERFVESCLREINCGMHKTLMQTATKLMIYAIEQKTGIKKQVYLPLI